MMTEQTTDPVRRGPLPPALFLAALLIQIAVHFLVPRAQVVTRPWNLLGVAIVIVGFTIVIAADRKFKRADTTVKPFEDSAALVTGGSSL